MSSRSPQPHPTVLCLALISSCANEPEVTNDPVAPEIAAEFRELVAADWELAPGAERYICVRQTFEQNTFVSAWSGQTPSGTHHVLLTISPQPDGEPDGPFECDSGTLGTQTLFGASVGTRPKRMPAGVAIKLAHGEQAILNLHIFNATDQPLRGRSGASVQTMEEKDVRELADLLQASVIKLEIPPGRSTSQGRCTLDRDATIFAVGPHMHQTGVALQAVAHTAVYGDIVLYDAPYSFDDQQALPLEPLQFKTGDSVDVICTYENDTGKTLHFGGSSFDEMCQVTLARFPAGGTSLCVK